MAQADGTILIDTRIETGKVKAGSKEIESAVRRMAGRVDELGNNVKASVEKSVAALTRQNVLYAQQLRKVNELKKTVKEYAEQEIPTEEYSALSQVLDASQKKLTRLLEIQERFEASGGDKNSRAYKDRALQIYELTASIRNARLEMKQLEDTGKAFTVGNNSEAAQKAIENLRVENAKLKAIGTELQASFDELYASVNHYVGETGQAVQYTGFLQSVLNGLKMAAHAPVSIFKALGTTLKTLPINAVRISVELAKTAFEKFGMAVKTALSQVTKFVRNTVTSGLKKITGGILGIHKSANKTSMSLGQMLKTGLLMSAAFRVFSGLISAMKTGFRNLAQYSGTTNSSISMLWSSLERLKNSLATAFAPILDVIAPILSGFIDMLSRAASYVSMFFAMLTGKSTYTRAVAVQKDYAASLADTAGAAGDAAKATDEAAEAAERYLSPLDDINKYTSNDSGSGGNGGSGGGAGGASPTDMFETVEIEPVSFDSWGAAFDAFLDYLLNTGIPALRGMLFNIANTVNEFVANVYEMFSFPGTFEKVRLLGQEVAQAFNDFVNWIDWEMIGAALGSGLNLAIQFLVNLIYTFDWMALGASIATMINRAISEIDWYAFGQLLWSRFKIAIETLAGFLLTLDMAQLAQAASRIVMGFFDSITQTIQNIDWQQLGEQVKTILVNIDWGGVATSVFSAIGAAFGAITGFLWGMIKSAIEEAWNGVTDWWHDVAYEDGKFTIQGLLEGIWEVMKSIGSWIKEHIFQPFIDGFKSAFGIHSPSKVMAEMGNYLMEGLYQGISSLIDNVISIFGDIRDKISSVWDSVKSKTAEVWDKITKNTSNIWNGLKDSVSSKFNDIKSTIEKTWDNARVKTSDIWGSIKNNLSDTWSRMQNNVNQPFNSIKSKIANVWDSIKQVFNGVITFIDGVFSGNWSRAWQGIKNIFSGIMSGLSSAIRSPINGIIGLVNGAISGINTLIRGANRLPGISIPTIGRIPYLASGAVIPPNKEFLAVLGDQTSGNNIEAPESLIRKIVREESGSGVQRIEVPVYLNRHQIARAIAEEGRMMRMRTGRNPFELA